MNKETMQDMILSFKEFLKDRNLELNGEKSKMLIFNKRGRDMKEKWIWNNKLIQEFKYLGFVMSNNGNYMDRVATENQF